MSKQNFMQFYRAQVVEIMLDEDNTPTTHLRIRVPMIHMGLSKAELPVARPMSIPGTIIDIDYFIRTLKTVDYIYVYFEAGDISQPMYIVPLTTTTKNIIKRHIDISQGLDKITTPKTMISIWGEETTFQVVHGPLVIYRHTTNILVQPGAMVQHQIIDGVAGVLIDGDLLLTDGTEDIRVMSLSDSEPAYIKIILKEGEYYEIQSEE